MQIVVVPEGDFDGSVDPLRIILARYPDGAHNAEAMAMHPSGDLFVITKERDSFNRRAMPAKIFKLSRAQLSSSTGEVQVFSHVGTLELPYLLYNYNLWGRLVTSFDISPDGQRLLILTYQTVVEVMLNLYEPIPSVRLWAETADFQLLDTVELPQQEAIAFLPDGSGFIYNTEYNDPPLGEVPLYRRSCAE